MLLIKTVVKPSKLGGNGLFADQFIPAGTKVFEYNHLTEIAYKQTALYPPQFHEFLATYGYAVQDLGIVINIDDARFMNHSDSPNLNEVDGCNYSNVDIQIGDELTVNYRGFDHGLSLCGSFLRE